MARFAPLVLFIGRGSWTLRGADQRPHTRWKDVSVFGDQQSTARTAVTKGPPDATAVTTPALGGAPSADTVHRCQRLGQEDLRLLTGRRRQAFAHLMSRPGHRLPKDQPNQPPRGDQTVLTLLYVEDQPCDVLLVTRLLQRRGGVALHVARCGTRGLQLAKDLKPDVILLDLHLPDLPGETVLHQLRALPGLGDTPVLVLSADASPERAQRLGAAGASAYLTKPLDVAAFFAHLRALETRPPVPGALTGSLA